MASANEVSPLVQFSVTVENSDADADMHAVLTACKTNNILLTVARDKWRRLLSNQGDLPPHLDNSSSHGQSRGVRV